MLKFDYSISKGTRVHLSFMVMFFLCDIETQGSCCENNLLRQYIDVSRTLQLMGILCSPFVHLGSDLLFSFFYDHLLGFFAMPPNIFKDIS